MKNRQTALWIGALVVGASIGLLGVGAIQVVMDFIAQVYTRLFQLLAVPTIALAIVATMASLGKEKDAGRIFRCVLQYTLLTTFIAALVGVCFYYVIVPENLSQTAVTRGMADVPQNLGAMTYKDHIIQVIPNNILKPMLEGNVLSILLMAFAFGIALSHLPESGQKKAVMDLVYGLQDLLFLLIRALVWTMPLGIMAFAAQLTVQVSGGMILHSLGKYTLVILLSNSVQMFLVLPMFLLLHRVNPIQAFGRMSPALLTAFFTKSSAATLPLTIEVAENRMKVRSKVSRFVLPICTTINMNGCAAFIAVTSIFVMQNSGIHLSLPEVYLWIVISVISAVGNAGVPMGCYFLTLSLMSGIGGSVGIMGVILPIYTIIDMVETAENVWSDSCVAIMTDKRIA